MPGLVLGIDLGGTNVKVALVDSKQSVLSKVSVPTRAEDGPRAVMDGMAQAARAALGEGGHSESELSAVGIGAPGPMNWQTGVVYSPPNLPGWKDVPLAAEMARRLGGLPCYVENDANAACFGEFWLGAGRGAECMCLLTLGTGVGGGIVTHGKLLRGIDGTAGEIGHLKVARDGRECGCGDNGCLETYASVSGMIQTAREGLESGRDSTLLVRLNGDLEGLTGKIISEAANDGDEFSTWVIEETGAWIGLGVASLVNLLNPEKVVLCGGMIAAGELLFSAVRDTVRARSFGVPAQRVEILPAGLGADSGVLGAAGCAFQRLGAEE